MLENVGVYISVESDNFNMFVPMERRITFLRGNSGVGKTSFVEYIRFFIENGESDILKVSYPKGYDIVLGSGNSIKSILRNSRNIILILDDSVYSEGVDFTNALMKYILENNIYLLIINRVDLAFDSSINSKFDYSAKSILWVDYDSSTNRHNVVPLLSLCSLMNIDNVDCIISEDTHGLTDFCLAYNKNNAITIDTTTPKTKDNIVSIIKNIHTQYNKIMLYVDLASFGKNIWDLYSYCSVIDVDIVLDFNYESFEYMLLSSKLFDGLWSIDNSINDVFSWEKYFEDKLEDVSKVVFYYGYKHKEKCPICLLSDCTDNMLYYCEQKCKNKLNGSKLKLLLNGTEFEYLIKLLLGEG